MCRASQLLHKSSKTRIGRESHFHPPFRVMRKSWGPVSKIEKRSPKRSSRTRVMKKWCKFFKNNFYLVVKIDLPKENLRKMSLWTETQILLNQSKKNASNNLPRSNLDKVLGTKIKSALKWPLLNSIKQLIFEESWKLNCRFSQGKSR